MSIELKLNGVDFEREERDRIKLQYIPAAIEENVLSNVDNYFNNYTEEVNGGWCESCATVFDMLKLNPPCSR